MQVKRVQSNQPQFKAVHFKTEEAKNIILTTFDKAQKERAVKLIEELEKTKHFDLEVSNNGNELAFKYRHRKNPLLDSQEFLYSKGFSDNKLIAYAKDIKNIGEDFYYDLRFADREDARKADELLNDSHRFYDFRNQYTIFRWAANSTKVLDKAADYAEKHYDYEGTLHQLTPKATAAVTNKSAQNTERMPFVERLKIDLLG